MLLVTIPLQVVNKVNTKTFQLLEGKVEKVFVIKDVIVKLKEVDVPIDILFFVNKVPEIMCFM